MQHISDTFWWLCDVTSVEEHLDFVFVRLLFESIEIDFWAWNPDTERDNALHFTWSLWLLVGKELWLITLHNQMEVHPLMSFLYAN